MKVCIAFNLYISLREAHVRKQNGQKQYDNSFHTNSIIITDIKILFSNDITIFYSFSAKKDIIFQNMVLSKG